MSDFLMVIPEGWAELATADAFIAENTEVYILDLINRGDGWAAIEALLQDAGHIPATAALADFRIFRDAGAIRIWYLLG